MTRQLIPVIQRPHDLVLAVVYNDSLPTTQILRQTFWQFDDWQVNFAIIGESHRICVRKNGAFMLEEMLACIDVPVANCEHHQSFTALQAHQYTGNAYSVRVDVQRGEVNWQTSEHEIAYYFPYVDGIQPITRIQWNHAEKSLQWRTLHTYIDKSEVISIHSQSAYQFIAEE